MFRSNQVQKQPSSEGCSEATSSEATKFRSNLVQKVVQKQPVQKQPNEDHHEHNNILMFIRDQNVCPEFQVKACGTQDTWHNTIGHPTTAI
ncbi:hypothetical protein MTR_5g063145 [Medicago truncatula]|uniref:Uncharacterized protein n=1 Tax=Medicago truncatula TaxID=3880 RepID=A0A072UE50_MEDTR|nr:hypothetical protein MTR_5g063145 [Medicago truncatula]